MIEHATLTGSLMPHMGLFLPTILGQGTEEQIGWWLFRALNFQIVGSYAQTELGHGSNVRALRTTATYDAATQVCWVWSLAASVSRSVWRHGSTAWSARALISFCLSQPSQFAHIPSL